MAKVFQCDRCGKAYTTGTKKYEEATTLRPGIKFMNDSGIMSVGKSYDLCPECMEFIMDQITAKNTST